MRVHKPTNINESVFDRRFRDKPKIDYTRLPGKLGRRDAKIVRELEEHGIHGRRCLDVGPGTGRWLQHLKASGAAQLAAVDISQESLDRVAPLGVDCQKADVEFQPLRFETDSFDITLAFMILEHLKDPGLFIDEVIRVTKASGLLLMTIPNISSFQSRIRLLSGLPPLAVSQDPTHVSFYTIPMLKRLFASHRATVEVIPTGFSLNPFDLATFQIPTNRLLCGLDDNRLFRVQLPGADA